MDKKYTYNLQFVFDGSGDAIDVMGYKSYNSDLAIVEREVLSQMVVNIHPQDVDNA